ncbi:MULTISPECIES: ATP-binding cassette domain-containing protein [unclassified Microbacterium]|uniref:ATP-binding cassette domain-containing protein n=1 Tax=unclassified Microbacterium TaxID=2609290 RepID=UPI00300FB468
MTFRPGPLRAAAVLAAVFVAARVVYRVLFHGADGDGVVLLALPEIRLPAPFAHVVLLGPVTADGLWDAAAGALPIALAILAFGVLNAVVDLTRVFARASRRGPLRGVARALAIAAATLPSLADGARAVGFAQRLRGERAGPRMLLPLLERTLERAGNVAAALELRGFAGRGLDGDCLMPVEAHDVEIGFGPARSGRGGPESAPDAVSRADAPRTASAMADAASPGIRLPAELFLHAGTLTLVSGATGSGKSTLLRAIAGLHSHTDGGWISGSLGVVGHERVPVPPRDLAQRVGVVLQHPREAFATELVRDEIGLSLELRGVAPVIAAARVAEVAERVGVASLLDRPTRGLSAGEATLVAIAAAIVEHPILLLVDEPLADLDADARRRIARLLDALAHDAGMSVVVAEHRVESLSGIADLVLRVRKGEVEPVERGEVERGDGAVERVDGAEVERGGIERLDGPVDRIDHDVHPVGPASAGAASAPPTSGSGRSIGVRGAPDAPRTYGVRPEPEEAPATLGCAGQEPVLRARGITVRHRDAIAVTGADLDLYPGEIVALVGPNGAGKSSLLAALALPERGDHVSTRGRVALVPDASDDLFVSDSVLAECVRADRRAVKRAPDAARDPRRHTRRLFAGRNEESRRNEDAIGPIDPLSGRSPLLVGHGGSSTADRFAGFLGLDPRDAEFAARLARHPRDLAAGERRCLALAIQLAARPLVLMVDEPTRGLDPAAREMVWAALASVAAAGAAVLVASHEPGFTARADRTLAMHAGVLAGEHAAATTAPTSEPASHAMGASPDAAFEKASGLATEADAMPDHEAATTPAAYRATPARTGDTSAPPTTPATAGTPPTAPRGAAASVPLRPLPGQHSGLRRLPLIALAAANLVALGAFCWPLVATAVPEQAHAAVPVAALALVPLAALVVVATLDGTVRSAHLLALLGTLAAIGAAVRIAGTGVGGVEAVFILLVLAGRAYGARFGMLLGMATIALSTLITGTFGPWTPFQLFACAWVGAVAGLLPRRSTSTRRGPRRSIQHPGSAEIAMLCVYGVVASYVFGLLMNLWFWPFAVGYGTGISYDGEAPLDVNLASFLVYSLVTSTLSWDTLRAITTVVGLVVVGRPILAALRRTKPLASRTPATRVPRERAPALS